MPERGMSPLVKSLRDQEFDVLEVRGRDSEAAPGEKWSARWGLGLQGLANERGRCKMEKCGQQHGGG